MSDPRCSAMAREAELQLAGTAPCAAGFLLVELPLPWPARLPELPLLDGVHAAIAEAAGGRRTVRLQLVEPDGAGRHGRLRVRLAERSRADRGSFDVQREAVVDLHSEPGDALARAARALLAGGGVPAADPWVVLHVCTNGRRDVCCGSLGTRLVNDLVTGLPGQIRRTTHTGGHRFAPTGFTLPDGAFWGHLHDPAVARSIVERSGPVGPLVQAAFRGTAHTCDPAVQVVEQVLLGLVGWDLLRTPRSAETALLPDGEARVLLHLHDPGHPARTFEAIVAQVGTIEVPGCRTDQRTAYEQLAVRSLSERTLAR